jgi:hypothetical protein
MNDDINRGPTALASKTTNFPFKKVLRYKKKTTRRSIILTTKFS